MKLKGDLVSLIYFKEDNKMAVAKRCDRCGKYYEGKRSNQCKIVQDGEDFYINSVRIGDWNALAKNWNNLASGYDICADCMKEIAEVIFDEKYADTSKIRLYKPDHEKTKKFIAKKAAVLAANKGELKEEETNETVEDNE